MIVKEVNSQFYGLNSEKYKKAHKLPKLMSFLETLAGGWGDLIKQNEGKKSRKNKVS